MSTAYNMEDVPGGIPRGRRRQRHERFGPTGPWAAYEGDDGGQDRRSGRRRATRDEDAVAFGPMQDERSGRGRRGGPRGSDGPWGRGSRGRRRGQAGRGDVRAALLALLAESPMHGYQMIGELAERSGGVWRPSPGSVYPTLAQLEDEDLISADESSGRRVFSLTEAGREHVAATPVGPAPWETMAESDPHRLHDLVRRLGVAVAQVDEAGTAEQRTRTAELIESTRKAVYRILAEDDTAD